VIQQQVEKKSANEIIKRLINCINGDNKEAFYKLIEEYKSGLVVGGKAYNELDWALRQRPIQMIPIAQLSHDVKKLLDLEFTLTDPVFINEGFKELLPDLLLEIKNKDIFREHNLPIRNKILLHGLTGNGKTTYAKYIAQQSELPYLEIKSDIVIDSRLGNTSGNINKIFTSIIAPCVMLWDEIDSIGKRRGGSDDSGATNENSRMTNSMLTNMDKLGPDVIFIGATNRIEIMDSAFLRRFDIVFEVKAPDEYNKLCFADQLANHYKIKVVDSEVKEMVSYSDIKRYMADKARKEILNLIKEQRQ
jgi:SpoVK/Ycf46/Vps4 family AAA+-type ATPase